MTPLPEFREWAKIARLNRDMIVTEKIDGTNAGVIVTADGEVFAQSRKRVITPRDDNFGFARWVAARANELALALGEGYHYGEWYGSGIQRGYGLTGGERRFMLFNVDRWAEVALPDGCEVATILKRWTFDTHVVRECVELLRARGSQHVPGFADPEGVVVYHHHANVAFKVTLAKDELPKALRVPAGERAAA